MKRSVTLIFPRPPVGHNLHGFVTYLVPPESGVLGLSNKYISTPPASIPVPQSVIYLSAPSVYLLFPISWSILRFFSHLLPQMCNIRTTKFVCFALHVHSMILFNVEHRNKAVRPGMSWSNGVFRGWDILY